MLEDKEEQLSSDDKMQPPKLTHMNQPWSERLKDLATAAGAVSAAVGIVFSSYTYVTTQWYKNDEAHRAQLSTFSTYGQYLKRYQTHIQPALGRLMEDPERLKLDQAMRRRDQRVCRALLDRTTTKTGFQVFMSPGLRDARDVHNFYESIGYGLAEGQLDFVVIFDLITLPAYWNIQDPSSEWYRKKLSSLQSKDLSLTYLYPDFSVLLPWRSCLGSGYFGPNKPLSDFSDGVDRLGFNYLFARAKYLYSSSCQNGSPKEDNTFVASSGTVGRSKADLVSACSTLRMRIREMAVANGRPKSWMKLYQGNQYDIDPDVVVFGRSYRFPWTK